MQLVAQRLAGEPIQDFLDKAKVPKGTVRGVPKGTTYIEEQGGTIREELQGVGTHLESQKEEPKNQDQRLMESGGYPYP